MDSPLEQLANRRRAGGFNARRTILHDVDVARCYTCRKEHPLRANNADQDYADFAFRHKAENGCVVVRLAPWQTKLMFQRAQRERYARHMAMKGFSHNASVLEAFQSSDQSVDLTSFNSLASSATAGWSSHYIDNSSNLYLDDIAYIKFAAVNTAPASNKAYYLYGASALNTTDLPASGASTSNTVPNSSSTSAALNFPSISTPLACLFPIVRVIPYPVQNITNTTTVFSLARAFGGFLGLFFWYPLLNFTGMTIAASGNVFKRRGVYNTVA